MSHPRERFSGKSEGGANQALEQEAEDRIFVWFCILMEFGVTEERKSDLLLQDSSCVQILKAERVEESKIIL